MSDLHLLAFRSIGCPAESGGDLAATVADVLAVSRSKNAAGGLTSALAVQDGAFFEVLEGPRLDVQATFQRIRSDPRHHSVELLGEQPVGARLFAGHPMALVGHSGRARDLLRSWSTSADQDVEGLIHTLKAMRDADISAGSHDPAQAGDEAPANPGLDTDRLRLELEGVAALQGERAGPDARAAIPVEMRTVLDMSATALLDHTGRFVRTNDAFKTLLGYGPGELDGVNLDVLILGDAGASNRSAAWAALARNDGRGTAAFRMLAKDGRGLEISLQLRAVAEDGERAQVVAVATDITAEANRATDARGQIAAIDRALAVAHFSPDGTILHANRPFLHIMGYELDDVLGRPHRLFVDPDEAASDGYAALWNDLAAGHHRAAEFKRIGKGGREVWLQASYNPILDRDGRVVSIVKYATDVTVERLRMADYQWQIAAIHKSHAVVAFDMHGVILDANAAFLDAMGYSLDEIRGYHHRIFVEPSHAHSAEYGEFWQALGRGLHQSGQYRRLSKDGREVWLQATYNPVFDMNGRPFKIVKYATVVTAEKLRQAELQGQIAAIHKAQCVIAFDLDGTILDANTNFLEVTGYRLSEVRGQHHRMFVDAATAESEAYKAFWRDLAAGKHQVAEYKRIGKHGREIWLQASYSPIFDMSGRPFRVIKYATDVTAEKMRQSDYEGQIAAIQKSQGVIAFALDSTILDANPVILNSLGYTLDEIRGRPHRMLVDHDQAASADYEKLWATLRDGQFASGLYKRIGKNGREVWIRASYNPILDLNGQPVKIIKFATDVTSDVKLAEAYEDAKRQAQHDSATALPNRTRLAGFMTSALAIPNARLVVLYIDIDRFKPINDTFGHQVGDRVLGEVADRLRRSLGNDQIVARVGGDEFVVVAPGLREEEIEAFCQGLMDHVGLPIRHDGGEIKVGLSVGIAVSPADGTTPDDLLRSADIALYRSKQNGRGVFSFFAAAMNDRIHAYRNLVEDMRRGLAQNEFYIDYQPRFAARTQVVQSVEALVRWNHPVHGRISPGDFIPLAERSGLIVTLGTWVLREACEAAAGWDGIGVSVNVSPVQFRNSDLVAIVTEALRDARLEPHRLELEITEGVLLEDAARARTTLDHLKALGVKLAMDDFGTGYSSLSSLRSFPFDVIKIDRQFVTDMEMREGGREIVRAILALGKALGLSVTAEGVETSNQLEMLAADACGEVQGYLLARPMSPARVTDLLADKHDIGPAARPAAAAG